MISDSAPWKEDLLRLADTLAKRKTQSRWTERTSFLVERDIMIGAYAVRKLIESNKVSDELKSECINVGRHALKGKRADFLSRHAFWEDYDMERGADVTLTLDKFSNQIIHSWIWMLSADGEPARFDGTYVSSDRASTQHLYFFHADKLISIFRSIGLDDVAYKEVKADENGFRRVVRASRTPTTRP